MRLDERRHSDYDHLRRVGCVHCWFHRDVDPPKRLRFSTRRAQLGCGSWHDPDAGRVFQRARRTCATQSVGSTNGSSRSASSGAPSSASARCMSPTWSAHTTVGKTLAVLRNGQRRGLMRMSSSACWISSTTTTSSPRSSEKASRSSTAAFKELFDGIAARQTIRR